MYHCGGLYKFKYIFRNCQKANVISHHDKVAMDAVRLDCTIICLKLETYIIRNKQL